ncbi:MAG: hypothetical protein ACKV2U_13550 [Bryobacteraceae bacterium]
MKTTILIVAAAAMSAAALQAQVPTLTAEVPFAFYKGDTQMPAGRYVVKPLGAAGLVLANSKAEASVVSVFSNRSVAAAAKGNLRFTCYGAGNTRCFLQEIAAAWSTVGLTIPQGKTEREFARNGNAARVARVEATTTGSVAGE